MSDREAFIRLLTMLGMHPCYSLSDVDARNYALVQDMIYVPDFILSFNPDGSFQGLRRRTNGEPARST